MKVAEKRLNQPIGMQSFSPSARPAQSPRLCVITHLIFTVLVHGQAKRRNAEKAQSSKSCNFSMHQSSLLIEWL